ncbi:hypothetical protein AVEN_27155-1 [Araneus ventricosus]|uniref:Uncharacterized protein n=1 Tax=Araneus ventricosus TaxID=182803 RepID=A0A4Y2VJQ5_ARAVE|nr:hypothetical protein AVEN_27155-1 [Araneus ventricosus]
MNSRRFPSPRKPLWKIRFTTQTPSLTLARPKIRLARIEPTKPAGAGVVVRVLTCCKLVSSLHFCHVKFDASLQICRASLLQTKIAIRKSFAHSFTSNGPCSFSTTYVLRICL